MSFWDRKQGKSFTRFFYYNMNEADELEKVDNILRYKSN